MACSDYLAVKKQRCSNIKIQKKTLRNSSQLTHNNQYCNLQNTNILDEDGDLLTNNRFNISISKTKKYSKYNNTLASEYSFMYSIPKIHTPEYIKNQYQPSFCWTCWTPLGEILNTIKCSVCDYTDEMQQIQNDVITEAYEEEDDKSFSNYIERLLYEFDMAEDNKNNGILYDLPSSFYNTNANTTCEESKENFCEVKENLVINNNINIYDIIQNFENSTLF